VSADPFEAFFVKLDARHRRDLEFSDIRKGVQALSSLYVHRRARLDGLLDGAGKRAAFALYYGGLHFLTVRGIVRALDGARPLRVLDLGCGTAAGGAAWALEAGARCDGIERSGWAVEEARFTLRALRLEGRITRGDLTRARLPGRGAGILLAFAANELADETRGRTLRALLVAHERGARVLVVEPLSRRITGAWWDAWSAAFAAAGGRHAEWRFAIDLPPTLALLDKASGLDHRELTARSLWLPA
jgi:SAM-dependent methyltransferase